MFSYDLMVLMKHNKLQTLTNHFTSVQMCWDSFPQNTFKCELQSINVSEDMWLVPEHRAQRINVLISVKCIAHMFSNTHSWYHSMSARPEEAVSYRCQYPRWPLSLPPPLHAHGTGGLSPRTKEWGVFCGGQATKHSRHNGESGWQVQLVHT